MSDSLNSTLCHNLLIDGKETCKFFRRGQCKFGDKCRRRHDTTFTPDALNSTKRSPSEDDSVVTSASALEKQHVPSSPRDKRTRPQKQDQPCFFWQVRRCRKGEHCEYMHDPEARDAFQRFVSDHVYSSHPVKVQQEPKERAEQRRIQRETQLAATERAEQLRSQWEVQRAAQEAEGERRRKAAEERAARRAEREIEMERQRRAAAERAEQLRIQQEARRAERARKEEAVTISQVELGSAIVTFSAGMAVDHIVTGFESCRVQVKNLPLDAKPGEVCEMLRAQGVQEGKFHLVGMKKVNRQQEASLIVDGENGKTVALGLDGIDFRGNALEFSVTDSGTIGGMYSARNGTTLTVRWRAPSVRIVASYGNVEVADAKMRELNGKVIDGRKLRVEHNRTRQGSVDSSSLLVTGFSPHTTDLVIYETFQTSVRRLRNAIEYNEDSANNLVKDLLSGGSPESNVQFEGPTLDSVEGNYILCARFDSWDKAKAAHDLLHEKKFPWIGNSTFRLWLPSPVQYQITIPTQQYKAQKSQWDTFVSSTAGRKGSFVLVSAKNNDAVRTLVRVGGDDSHAVGMLKVRVERLAAGEKLDLWHRSFGATAGQQFFESIYATVGAHVTQDWRMKIVKVYGEPSTIAKAREMIMEEINRLSLLEHTVLLKRQSVRFFTQHGIASLKETFGDDSVTLDVSTSPCRITIRSGEEARHALSRLIEESLDELATANAPPKDETSACPICLDEVSTPVQLGCGHEYCTACIRHCFTSDIKNFPIVCMGNAATCLKPIALPIIQRFLTPQQFNVLLKTAAVSHIEKNPQSYKYCPTPDCVQIYRHAGNDTAALQLHCPSCLTTICSRCQEGHDGMTCEERRIQGDPAEQERLNEQWAKQAGVKKCPSCSVWIEKTEGCNHMSCRCGAHVCWVCLGLFEAGDIYGHLEQVHGGLVDYED